MRSESIISFLRQIESLRLDRMTVLTSKFREAPGRDECRPTARGNRRSAVESARATALSLIACALDDGRNPFPLCTWFYGKLPAFTPPERCCNHAAKDGSFGGGI